MVETSAVIEILDLSGRRMEKYQLDLKPGNQTYSITTSHLPAGVYLIRLKTNKWVNIKKLIFQ